MSLEKAQYGDIYVLTPRKNLSGGDETAELQAVVHEIVEKGAPKIIVDLGNVSYINSTGLGALIAMHTSCKNRQGMLRLARIGKRIESLFLITKLSLVFETFDSVEGALVGVDKTEESS